MIESGNKTASFYGLISVYSKWDTKKLEDRKLVIPGFTCFDFVYVACNVLHKMGAYFHPLKELAVEPKRDFINIYVKEAPLEVSLDDPKVSHKSLFFLLFSSTNCFR